MSVTKKADVVVVGAGNAAISSALAAAESGADAAVFEKASELEAGGNTWFTAGAFRVAHGGLDAVTDLLADPADPRLAATELDPYPEASFRADLDRVTGGRCDPELAAVLVSEALDGVWWLRDHGVPFELMYHRQAYEVDGRHRFWGGLALGVVGGGKTLAAEELRAAGRARIDLVYGAPVSDLDVDEAGAVRGVLLGDGRRCRSRAVVLGSGGFQADPGMRARYLGEAWSKAKVRGTRHNAGDGLRMALAAGAARAGDWASCHSVAWDADAPASGDHEPTNRHTKQSYPLGIIVNSAGERFFDEGADFRNYTYARLGAAIIEQPGSVAFQVFDDKTAPLLRREEYEVPGIIRHEARDPRSLAEMAGIDPDGLEHTVCSFNSATRSGGFDPTTLDGLATRGAEPPKSNWAQPLDRPPYVAVKVTCGITFTFGGLKIDVDGRVIGDDGQPITGLYAAGEIVGGLFFGNYPGGSGLLAGTVFGRRAGRAAARGS